MTQPAPDTIDRVRLRYRRIVSHIELASRAADTPLSAQQIWHLMARTASPGWARAYSTLQIAQQHITYLDNSDNKPLGAIGAALESEHTVAAENAFLAAQSHFTLVDEKLRGKKFLNMLLSDIVARQEVLEVSMGISEGVLNLTLEEPARTQYRAPARPLRASFGALASKVATLVRGKTQRAAAPKL